MEAHARAGIDIYDSVLRYAEVEQYGTRYRLLRLGSCDFDFHVADELLRGGHPAHLATVAEALRDVFAGSVADELQVALHPPVCHAFFTPLPAGATDALRRERLQEEAALLAGDDEPLRLTADVLPAGPREAAEVDWVHVLALREPVQVRFDQVLRGLPQPRHRPVASMQAAAAAIGGIERRGAGHGEETRPPFTLALGWYPTHIEYTLCRHGRWYYSQHAAGSTPADSAYFAVALLGRLNLRPADVGRLFIYGQDVNLAAFSVLSAVFPVPPERLNPLVVVDLDPGSLAASFDAEAYVPCVGAAL